MHLPIFVIIQLEFNNLYCERPTLAMLEHLLLLCVQQYNSFFELFLSLSQLSR